MSDLMVTTDDGGWKAFKPLIGNFIMRPGSLIDKNITPM
jgi:hypothetical protein